MIDGILIFVIFYLIFLLAWTTISLVAYAATITLKKPIFIKTVSGFSQAVGYILLFLLSLYFVFLILSFFTSNIFLIILGALFFGSIIAGIVGSLLNFIIMPFMLVPIYLSERFEKDIEGEDIVEADILDDKNNVIGKTGEGSGVVNKNLATLFLINYFLIEAYVYLHRFNPQYANFGLVDYITTPIIWIGSEILVFGPFVLIFHYLKNKKFFPRGKKGFLILILKIDIVLTSLFLLLSILLLNL